MRKTISACAMVYLLFLATSCGSGLESALRKHQGEEAIAGIEGMINEAGVNAANGSNVTVMMIAASYGYTDVVKALIKEGADFNAESRSGETALSLASGNGYTETVKLLLKEKVNIDALNGVALRNAAEYGHLEVVKMLVNKGADVNAESSYDTPILLAVQNEYIEIVEYLINKGADVVSDGLPLSWAVKVGNLDLVDMLLKEGADLSLYSISVTDMEHVEVMQFLLDSGYEINDFDTYITAIQYDKNEFLQLALKNQKGLDAFLIENQKDLLYYAINGRNLEGTQILIDAGIDVNGVINDGYTALGLANRINNAEIMTALIKAGADVNILIDDTPFIFSILHRTELVKLTLTAGSNINIVDNYGRSLLANVSQGFYTGSVEIVSLLIDGGVEINSRDEDGKTPLFYAREFNETEIEELLLAAGATE